MPKSANFKSDRNNNQSLRLETNQVSYATDKLKSVRLESNQVSYATDKLKTFDKLAVSDNKSSSSTHDLNIDNVFDKYIESKQFRDVEKRQKCVAFMISHLDMTMVLNFMDKFQQYQCIDLSEIKSIVKEYSRLEK